MKKIIIIIVILANSLFTQGQQKGGIYFLNFSLDEDLVTELQLTLDRPKILNQVGIGNIFPKELLDSIRLQSEIFSSEILKANVECIYKKNKKGKNLTTTGALNDLEGMPVNTLNNAIETNAKDLYVRIDVQFVARGGIQVSWPWGKKYKLRPVVELRLMADDVTKQTVYSKKIKIKSFPKLRVRERNFQDGDIILKRSEVLHPLDIYEMYLDAIDAFKASVE